MSKKIVSYPGREITTEEVRKGKVLESIQKVEPRYNWAAGVAISRFLVELKNGKIIGRKCSQCQRILVPPRMYCELCYRPTDEWVEVKNTGTVNLDNPDRHLPYAREASVGIEKQLPGSSGRSFPATR